MKKIILVLMLIAGISSLYAKEITISVGAGQNWKQKREPQFAVWLEDSDGNFVSTLYVTERAGRENWIMSPKEGRPESLPVWYSASKQEGVTSKAASADEGQQLDAVTGATPKGGIIFAAEIEDKPYIIRAEFNTSFDYNDFYTKKSSGVNGQPSVVYSAEIPQDFCKESGEIKLVFSGYGSIDGSDGGLHTDASKLTTAKSIVKLVSVTAAE
ncbi:MAG: DUF2271 domain-containing protein [Spirochaetaceae bacterium]|nr:DUF2271 domain-containing protein [Spirochaetaceae bacterium]